MDIPVTDAQRAALRAFLVHDAEEATRLTRQLGEKAMRDYQYLADAALSVIAGWRFRKGYSNADVVRCMRTRPHSGRKFPADVADDRVPGVPP
jgi:hypothetical protein